MGEAARVLDIENNQSPGQKSVFEKIKATYTDELVLGICTHIGSNRDIVVKTLTEILKDQYKYQVQVIKLSDYINKYYNLEIVKKEGVSAGYSILKHKIEGGDYLRKSFNSNSLLAELAIKHIREDRELYTRQIKKELGLIVSFDEPINDQELQSRRVCYIIDSLKNIEELNILRGVYRDVFYLFSVYTPSDERIKYLIDKPSGLTREEAESIIQTDEYEDVGDHGQNVRDTFVEADFFIRSSVTNEINIQNNLERYLNLIFDTEIITPFSNEIAMYFAKSAAGNSACLSRQVGATITDIDGVVIAQGWNDVPKYGGNLYRANDETTHKCYVKGFCSNVTHRNEIMDDIISRIKKLDFNDEEPNTKKTILHISNSHNSKSKFLEDIEEIIRGSRFKSIIEYSRSIHAEMHAIVIGSQMTGKKMVGGDLYCTTYPCHNCARHIVLAGIKNIYYIEPYKKSLCITLHHDSLTESESDEGKVRILMYDGVAPRSYLHFFTMEGDKRKHNNGKVKTSNKATAYPKKRISLQSLPTLESQAVHALSECGILEKELGSI